MPSYSVFLFFLFCKSLVRSSSFVFVFALSFPVLLSTLSSFRSFASFLTASLHFGLSILFRISCCFITIFPHFQSIILCLLCPCFAPPCFATSFFFFLFLNSLSFSPLPSFCLASPPHILIFLKSLSFPFSLPSSCLASPPHFLIFLIYSFPSCPLLCTSLPHTSYPHLSHLFALLPPSDCAGDAQTEEKNRPSRPSPPTATPTQRRAASTLAT